MRALALFTAWTLAVIFLVGGIYRFLTPQTVAPSEEVSRWAEQLADAPVARYPEILGKLTDTLFAGSVPMPMVMVVQAAPDGKAIVLAVPPDSSDDPEADHWPSPWTNLNRELAQMPDTPIQSDDKHAGTHYRHEAFPIAGRAGQYLVLSIPSTGATGSLAGLRWFVAAVLCALAGTYFAVRMREA